MTGNFGQHLDDVSAETEQDDSEPQSESANTTSGMTDDEFMELVENGLKEKTIGLAASEELVALHLRLQKSDKVDVDVSQSLRDHLISIARRHPEVITETRKIREIERGD